MKYFVSKFLLECDPLCGEDQECKPVEGTDPVEFTCEDKPSRCIAWLLVLSNILRK
jgi:hypothetical protein